MQKAAGSVPAPPVPRPSPFPSRPPHNKAVELNSGRGIIDALVAALQREAPMNEEHTTAAVQRYLDELAGDSPAEPAVRALLGRAVRRLHQLCAALLYKGYPRLTRP